MILAQSDAADRAHLRSHAGPCASEVLGSPSPKLTFFFGREGEKGMGFLPHPLAPLSFLSLILTFLPAGVVLDIREGLLSLTFGGGGVGGRVRLTLFFFLGGRGEGVVQNTNQLTPFWPFLGPVFSVFLPHMTFSPFLAPLAIDLL